MPASRDLEAILDYISENQSMDVAEKLMERVNQTCQRLAQFPGLGKRRDELWPDLRSFPVNNYLIFYRQIAEGVEILRIISGYRDLKALFEIDE
ncbi:type II toxin-antitoxin system RelE/ParE family toxin [Roseofilum sp. BLCC_M91]|uniref:Type II toxin-antitoxin system RelE/ParE family toxin n=1 Tax=Roseofilum halophilum BLCC-M91 TaxID=3022259 RepID=A0ABT7BGZ1_9CYAN|nr:type II toxin-antitoxin system RelE/ParE family toxin [Roseofilum halophilum]MDJ1178449.1 type II toxin-antitoxin system RelE/ParE family toxin [Roseofilum halophilum BLCC-M91]